MQSGNGSNEAETKPRAWFGAAFIQPYEPFQRPFPVLGTDARPSITNRDLDLTVTADHVDADRPIR